jgi:hypothetical protein
MFLKLNGLESYRQGSFFLAAKYGGRTCGWLQIHQPQVLPPYFGARKKNPGYWDIYCYFNKHSIV